MYETPLHHFGNFVRSLLQNIPLEAARYLFLFVMVAVLILVLRLPTSETTPDRPGPSRWDENLKVWAALALLIQLAVYWFI